MNNILLYLLTALVSYLAGSLPFALITGKLFKHVDIRETGSGNAGAANVYRLLGLPAAVAVFLLDFAKGLIPVLILKNLEPSGASGELLFITSLTSLIIGHAFPVFAGFRGGKGVAVAAGGITGFLPALAPVCLGIFLMSLLITRYVSLSSLITAWCLPVFYTLGSAAGYFSFSLTILLFFTVAATGITGLHWKNIRRLLLGEEVRIGGK